MGCWRWLNSILKEADADLNEKNREKIDEVIHQYIGEKSSYGKCSADWRKARKQIKADEKMRQELIEKISKVT